MSAVNLSDHEATNRGRLLAQARGMAMKELRRRHQDEWNNLLAKAMTEVEREMRGRGR